MRARPRTAGASLRTTWVWLPVQKNARATPCAAWARANGTRAVRQHRDEVGHREQQGRGDDERLVGQPAHPGAHEQARDHLGQRAQRDEQADLGAGVADVEREQGQGDAGEPETDREEDRGRHTGPGVEDGAPVRGPHRRPVGSSSGGTGQAWPAISGAPAASTAGASSK